MGIIESIKKGFGVAHTGLNLVLMLFVYNVVINLIYIPIQARMPMPLPGQPPVLPAPGLITISIIINAFVLLLGIFINGGILNYSKGAASGTLAMENFWEGGKKYYGKLFLLGLVVFGFVALLFAIGALLVGVSTAAAKGAANPISLVFMVIIGIIGLVSLLLVFFSPYSIVAQDEKLMGAIKQSVNFVKTYLGAFLGLAAILVLIGLAIGFVLGLLLGFLGVALAKLDMVVKIISAVLSSALTAYLLVVATACLMNFYLGRLGLIKGASTQQAA